MSTSPDIEKIIGKIIKENRRSTNQNSMMWALLSDIASQVEWHGQRLSKNDWKWIFTAAVRHQRMVPGLDGGVVYLGEPTSAMSKQEISDLIELIYAFGSERGVEWAE
jgi:ABC-type sugar transport system ATPase subunit